jgi:hypothetical protein
MSGRWAKIIFETRLIWVEYSYYLRLSSGDEWVVLLLAL